MAVSNIIVNGLEAALDTERIRLRWQVFDPNGTSGSTSLQLNTVEIWRSTTDSVATATKLTETRANRMIDPNITAGVFYFYWVCARDNSGNLGDFYPATNGVSVFAGFLSRNTSLINGRVDVSTSAGALIFTLKTALGGDPTPDNPVIVQFFNADGSYNPVAVIAPLAITFPSGSNFGGIATETIRLYVSAILKSGAVYLAVGNRITEPTSILTATSFSDRFMAAGLLQQLAPLADQGAFFWTDTAALDNSPSRLISFHEWTAAPAAGVWSTAPQINTLWGDDLPKPGTEINPSSWASVAMQDFSFPGDASVLPLNDTVPDATHYAIAASLPLTIYAAANLLQFDFDVQVAHTANAGFSAAGWSLGADIIGGMRFRKNPSVASDGFGLTGKHFMKAGITGRQIFRLGFMTTQTGAISINSMASTRYFGGVVSSAAQVVERMG